MQGCILMRPRRCNTQKHILSNWEHMSTVMSVRCGMSFRIHKKFELFGKPMYTFDIFVVEKLISMFSYSIINSRRGIMIHYIRGISGLLYKALTLQYLWVTTAPTRSQFSFGSWCFAERSGAANCWPVLCVLHAFSRRSRPLVAP